MECSYKEIQVKEGKGLKTLHFNNKWIKWTNRKGSGRKYFSTILNRHDLSIVGNIRKKNIVRVIIGRLLHSQHNGKWKTVFQIIRRLITTTITIYILLMWSGDTYWSILLTIHAVHSATPNTVFAPVYLGAIGCIHILFLFSFLYSFHLLPKQEILDPSISPLFRFIHFLLLKHRVKHQRRRILNYCLLHLVALRTSKIATQRTLGTNLLRQDL